MLWLLLITNVVITVISLRKRMLPFAIQMLFFLFLVIGQSFTIQSDLQGVTVVAYRNADLTVQGFDMAVWFITGITLITLLLVVFSRGYRPGSQVQSPYVFNPPNRFYVMMLGILLSIGIVLIFGVVGLSTFLNSSRPGFQHGSTIFIVLFIIGIVPCMLKLITGGQLNRGDIACLAVTVLLTTGFSRIHDVLYAFALGSAYFYARWADFQIPARRIFITSLCIAVGGAVFFIVGSIREAQNYTGGSFTAVTSYIFENSGDSLLSLQQTYRINDDGMSGLAGAMSKAIIHPNSAHYDLGIFWVLKGFTQWWPSPLKFYFSGFIDRVDAMQWYTLSNVPSGQEEAFTSFWWFGVPFYAISIWLLEWVLVDKLLHGYWSLRTKTFSYIFIGCGLFFVRGSYFVWIGFVLSYVAVLFVSWPLFKKHLVLRLGEPTIEL